MAHKLVDLTKIAIFSTGTGPLALGSAVPGFRGVEALTDGEEYTYSIQQGGSFELGAGFYDEISGTLTRGVFTSSNGDTAINLTPNAVVTFTVLARDLLTVAPPAPPVVAPASGMDIPFRFMTPPEASEVVDFLVLATEGNIPAGMLGAVGYVDENPLAAFVLSLRVGGTLSPLSGTQVGTITVSTAGVISFATLDGNPVVIPAGSLVKLVAPVTPDTGISGLAVTLKA